MNERIRGSEPVVEKIDCQVVLLSGLYGCGKTTWAKKYLEDNPTKHFELLNVESILNRMTVSVHLHTEDKHRSLSIVDRWKITTD